MADGQGPTSRFLPALVFLSGSRRGTTQFLRDDTVHIAVSARGDAQIIGATRQKHTDAAAGGLSVGTLERRGQTYELKVARGTALWVNGEQVESMVLASGDVLELGRPGTVLRFRLYPADRGPYKTMAEAFSDCVDCAQYGGAGLVERTGILLSGIPWELATQTRPAVRVGLVAIMALLVFATGALWVHNVRLERRLAEESARVDGLAELVEAAETELEEALLDATTRVESLEAREAAPGRVISASSRSVVFIQGAYGFNELNSGKPLRFLLGPDERPVSTPGGTPVTVEGDGPEVEILYTGTAFVATGEGHLLTNRHVAIPWEFEPSAQETIKQGFKAVMRRMIGYLPEVEQPFEVELVAASVRADLALLRCHIAKALPPLELAETAPTPGDEVIVLGYPAGMQALVARAGASVAEELLAQGEVDFWTLASGLSQRGLIAPLATRGIVGQVTSDAIVYDAETTHGGSGGPVLGVDGKVVAVNAAIIPQFGGSNLGVPASEARRLIDAQPSK